jgi:hypothetical protein
MGVTKSNYRPLLMQQALVWNDFGPSHTQDSETFTRQRANVSDFSFIPGFRELGGKLERDGYVLSPRLSVGAYERTVRKSLHTYPYPKALLAFSFFASLRFQKRQNGGFLTIHRAARADPQDSMEAVSASIGLEPPNTGTLTWTCQPEIEPGPTRTSLLSLAFMVNATALAIADEFATIDIPYRRAPTNGYPNGRDAVFSISKERLSAKTPRALRGRGGDA